MKRLNAKVTGRVQGVGFRDYVWHEASKIKATGFVKNLPDRSVEVIAEGDDAQLEALLAKLWKGPMLARVDEIHQEYAPATEEFVGFEVRY